MINSPGEWVENLKKIGLVAPIWDRPVSPEELQYFLDRWPFLQLLSTNAVDPLPDVQQVAAKSNWVILNYGDALTSSPGQLLWGDDGSGTLNPGKGTVWRQALDTAADMVMLARKLGWTGIHVVDGHPLMKRAVWMSALDENIDLEGFTPTERDEARRERVKRSALDDIRRFHYRP